MRITIPTILFSVLALVMPLFGHAQVVGSPLSLALDPSFPQAGESYTVALAGNDSNRASIRWFLNGVENSNVQNKDTISLVGPSLTETTKITARITYINGTTVDVTHTVIPHRVDILISADTLVPAFYQGRALPSSGSTVTATAFIFSKDQTPSSHFTYVWRINNKVQNGGGLYGVNTVSFTPSFDASTQVSVDIKDSRGNTIASRSISVPIATPKIEFYEQNPLKGLSLTTLANPYIFIGDEVTIRAEGYYMSKGLTGSRVMKDWQINNKSVKSDPNDPDTITIAKKGNSGKADLLYKVRNLAQLLQGAQKKISIQF